MNRFFVLGAFDPEMEEISRVLDAAGLPWTRATVKGRPVRASEAYGADGIEGVLPAQAAVVFVECEVLGLRYAELVDHHRPGDPGYGMPPERYLEGSSLGQVLAMLGLEATDAHRVVAAADHCLAHAYRGACPGVTPDALGAWRLASRAARHGVPVEVMRERVEHACRYLVDAQKVRLADHDVAWIGADAPNEVAEASARCNIPFSGVQQDGARWKANIMSAPPVVIEAWMAQCGLSDIYGDPQRGFAGGYFR